MATLPEILTLSEVAVVLRVKKAVAWRLAKSGRLPSFRVGKAYRVTRSNLDKFIGGRVEKR